MHTNTLAHASTHKKNSQAYDFRQDFNLNTNMRSEGPKPIAKALMGLSTAASQVLHRHLKSILAIKRGLKIFIQQRLAFAHEKWGKPAKLHKGKKIRFMISYCENDSPDRRSHFLGDIGIKPENGGENCRDIDASVFGF